MDPAVKTALAVCVVVMGFCAAQFFRHGRPPMPAPQVEESAAQLLIPHKSFPQGRKPTAAQNLQPRRTDAGTAQSARQPELSGFPSEAVVLGPGRQDVPPPLPKEYPDENGDTRSSALRPLRPIPFALLAPPADGQRKHRVVDGDTLPALAERYLGDGERWGEIFAANRDVLVDPRLLPIGVELKIPPLTKSPDERQNK